MKRDNEIVQNAYGVDDFKTVKCTRCKQVYKCNTSGQGFCSHCDRYFFDTKYRTVTKMLVVQTKPIPLPAEAYE